MGDIANSSHRPTAFGIILRLLKQMSRRSGGVRRSLIAGAGLELAGIILGVAGPLALKLLVDGVSHDGTAPSRVIGCALVFVGAWAASAVFASWRIVYTTRIVDNLAAGLIAAFARERLPQAATARDGDSGAMLGQIERLPYSLTIVVDGLIWRMVPTFVQFVATLFIVAVAVPLTSALILGAVIVLYGLVTWRAAAGFRIVAARVNAASGAASGLCGDIFRNARRVVLNGALESEAALLTAAYAEKAGANRAMTRALTRASFAQYAVIGCGLSLLLVMSAVDALSHKITPGAFILLQTYAFRLILPVSGLGYILSQASTALGNIGEVMVADDRSHTTSAKAAEAKGPARIALRDVSFSYGPGLPGLSGVDLDIPAGSFVAVVGPNGSGKSTLAQIMAGLLQPANGAVRVGELDLNATPSADRHRIVLYVPQFIGLFNRTLADNVLYPPTRHSGTEITDILTGWQFHETGRPIDLSIMVGEQGERLSGGQIQKLELARVAGIAASVIIFDESTSALDPAAEEAIVADLRRRFAGKTTVVMITHRQGVARQADQVLFMRAGRIVRRGPHADLMRDLMSYQKLWHGTEGAESQNGLS
jgi:ABC-type multidrug transport system fused ATPase/permease subunit